MKLIQTLLLAISLAFLSSTVSAATIGGVNVPDTHQYGGKNLVLNGAGVRKRFFIQIYVGALYLTAKSNDGNTLAKANQPMTMRIEMTTDRADPAKMKASITEGFKKATGGNLAPIQADLDKFIAVFEAGVAKGDIFEFSHVPGSGLHALRNSQRVAVLTNPAFKETLFAVWLSNKAVDTGLRDKLLGK